jgi:Ca2+ transporting ATPase
LDDAPFYYTVDGVQYMTEEKIEHYTIIFHVFVFMQVFNEINSRKLGQTLNVFSGFFNNLLFLIIILFTIVV